MILYCFEFDLSCSGRSTVVSSSGNKTLRENIADVFGPKQVLDQLHLLLVLYFNQLSLTCGCCIYRLLVYVGFKLLSLKFYKCKLICLWRCKVLWSSRNMTQVKKLWMSSISSSLKISGIASGLLYNYSESFTNLAVIYSVILKLSFLYILYTVPGSKVD